MTDSRLIERAFPLKQASLNSVHEKNVRHGHISTLHIWPARRPLAASRAALIATLLPDPGNTEERQELCGRIGGEVVERIEKKKMPGGRSVERIREETEGGILRWLGPEPTSGGRRKREEYRRKAKSHAEKLGWFLAEIRNVYGGHPPRVLDPFAGGGAIPLEAMRMGCEVTAVDVNPVAWFILKCTLDYPRKLGGKTHPLPAFILDDEQFMNAFGKAHPGVAWDMNRSKKPAKEFQNHLPMMNRADPGHAPDAGLAWHVRAWGKWVLDRARKELAQLYPTYADFVPLAAGKRFEKEPTRLVPLKGDGTPDIDALNAEFSDEYIADTRNPRWVAKPTVAYLWARTVICKNCRATVPLLKTRWLARTNAQRVMLQVAVNDHRNGVRFSIESDVPKVGGNNAQRREHDRHIGTGTMSQAGVKCPCCGAIMTLEDIQLQGRAGQLGRQMTVAVVRGSRLKEFRLPTTEEVRVAVPDADVVGSAYSQVPFGLPHDHIVEDAKRNTWCVQYGLDTFAKLFTERQLVALGVLARVTRAAGEVARDSGYSEEWAEALVSYLSCVFTRLCDYLNCGAQWKLDRATINHFFVRYALPVSWDFAEGNVLGDLPGSYDICLRKIGVALDGLCRGNIPAVEPDVRCASAISVDLNGEFDAVITDPPYYNAIGYAVIMDYFYVWLRRLLSGLTPSHTRIFESPLTPKWDSSSNDGELVDDASRHGGDAAKSKQAYEDGMVRVFARCAAALKASGRLVVVFANKQPDAWETLVSSIIRAGFVVDGSWPIQTEQSSRMRAQGSAALASSVWLVCRRRPASARPGWDNNVLQEMQANIAIRLREYWDAGIRGPDFVWAATGPALEAYSKHPVVKKANDPGKAMEVGEFLSRVRRMVVDFVVGQVLTGGDHGGELATADRMDAPTAYYLLHRHDFGLEEAPFGACILYATACGLSDRDLESVWDILVRTGGGAEAEDEDEESDDVDPDAESEPDEGSDSGSKVKLKTWVQRKQKAMGYEAPDGRPVPLIDRIHRLMHLWRAGDVLKLDEYLDDNALRRQELFKRLLQSLIELSRKGGEPQELQILESLSNHVQAKGAKPEDRQATLALGRED